MLEAAGVALYISGMDHLMQHFKPVARAPHAPQHPPSPLQRRPSPGATAARAQPSWANVDYIVVGNGAYAEPNATAATAMPHALDCPDTSLQFSYAASTGFASVQVASANAKMPSTLHVNFFDWNQTMMYTFYKYNPRTAPGHLSGNLKTPPAPGFGGHGGGFNWEPLIILGGAFLVVAVALCLFGAANHARRQLSYMNMLRGRSAAKGGVGGGGGGGGGSPRGAGEDKLGGVLGENTPLIMRNGRVVVKNPGPVGVRSGRNKGEGPHKL